MPIIASLLLFLAMPSYAKTTGYKCNAHLSSEAMEARATSTNLFISYVNKLLEDGVITSKQLQNFIKNLEQSKLVNPVPLPLANSDYEIHFESLQEYIDSNQLDQNQILAWANSTLEKLGVLKLEKQQAAQKTAIAAIDIEFKPIPKGQFELQKTFNSNPSTVTLTHNTELMTTMVTEAMWASVMDPSAKIETNKVDYPKTNVTWWSAAEYSNRLSIKNNLPPVYDFSEVIFDEKSKAEDGTLLALSGKAKINAPEGNIYLAKGYRLPTDAEYTWLRILINNFDVNLLEHEWLYENSNGEEHPVKEKAPYIVDGHRFYDINGHALEWGNDWSNSDQQSSKNLKGNDPRGLQDGQKKSVWGVDTRMRAGSVNRFYAALFYPTGMSFKTLGFRLIRTLD